MTIRDEEHLRAGLEALTYGPPPPRDLVAHVVLGAARARRRRRAIAMRTAVAAMVMPMLGVSLPPIGGGAAVAPIAASVARWPDRREPALHGDAEAALAAWRQTTATPQRDGEGVRWLYAADVPGTEQVAVAFAVCREERCDRAVLAYRERGASAPEWSLMTREIGPGHAPVSLTAYLLGPRLGSNGPSTVILVVPPPGTARVTYAVGEGGPSGELTRSGAAFVGNVGFLPAPASVSLLDSRGRVVATEPVGEPGTPSAVPRFEWMPRPRPVKGYTMVFAERGQADGPQERYTAPPRGGDFFVAVGCRGGGRMALLINRLSRRLPCDGTVRRVELPQVGRYQVEISDLPGPHATYVVAIYERA